MLETLLSYLLHLDQHLTNLINCCGVWTYIILFAVIFSETGLVIFPFFPGDSLLFAAGMLAAKGMLNIHVLVFLLTAAAIIGNSVNYWIGTKVGLVAFKNEKSLLFKKSYLTKTNAFYAKYGGKALVIARFIPVVRTYVPFVAGVGNMSFVKFSIYNLIGALSWVTLILYLSYFFGSIPIVKNNFSIVVILVIIISLAIPVIEWARVSYRERQQQKKG
jgi:membrane-associated protein